MFEILDIKNLCNIESDSGEKEDKTRASEVFVLFLLHRSEGSWAEAGTCFPNPAAAGVLED